MKFFSKTILILVGVVAMNSCAKVNQTVTQTGASATKSNVVPGGGLPASVVSESSIQGNWKSACTSGLTPLGPSYTTSKMSIENDAITTDTISYDDATCTAPISEEARISSFTVVVTDLTTLEETASSIQLRPLNTVMAKDNNQSKYCGITHWASGTYVSIPATDIPNCSGLTGTAAPHAKLYGTVELYLDDCLTDTDVNCTRVRYTRVVN